MVGVGTNVMSAQVMCARIAHPGDLSECDDLYLCETTKPIYGRKERSALFTMVAEWKHEKRSRKQESFKLALFQSS